MNDPIAMKCECDSTPPTPADVAKTIENLIDRKIKFRAWDRDLHQMTYAFCGKSGDEAGDWILFFPDVHMKDGNNAIFGGHDNPYPRQRFVLMESVVISAWSGFSIPIPYMAYEGDIVECHDGELAAVVFAHNEFTLLLLHKRLWGSSLCYRSFADTSIKRIAGNIYENEELVNKPEERKGLSE